MSDQDTGGAGAGDDLQLRIEQAQSEGRDADAQALYQRQQGTTDPYGLEPVEPDAEGEDTDAQPPASRDITVATNADDETVRITTEMDFANNPDHVKEALESMAVWDADGNNWVEELKAHWGSDLPANLGYARAFSEAHPDVAQVLETVGLGDHPGLVLAAAILGRRYSTRAGDPSENTTQKAGVQAMTTEDIDTDFDEKTTQLMDEAAQARSAGNLAKSTRLQKEIDAMFAKRYGGEPIVGSGGRTL